MPLLRKTCAISCLKVLLFLFIWIYFSLKQVSERMWSWSCRDEKGVLATGTCTTGNLQGHCSKVDLPAMVNPAPSEGIFHVLAQPSVITQPALSFDCWLCDNINTYFFHTSCHCKNGEWVKAPDSLQSLLSLCADAKELLDARFHLPEACCVSRLPAGLTGVYPFNPPGWWHHSGWVVPCAFPWWEGDAMWWIEEGERHPSTGGHAICHRPHQQRPRRAAQCDTWGTNLGHMFTWHLCPGAVPYFCPGTNWEGWLWCSLH